MRHFFMVPDTSKYWVNNQTFFTYSIYKTGGLKTNKRKSKTTTNKQTNKT